jgi:hypothetical protein
VKTYFRAAQAYMLISMPTGTSTILGVFQVIPSSHDVWREHHAESEPRTTTNVAQVRESGAPRRDFSHGQGGFSLGQSSAIIFVSPNFDLGLAAQIQ